MGLLDRIFARLDEIRDMRTPAERAAELVEAKLKSDATTRRGNVPQFGPGPKGRPMSYVPISVTADGEGIKVSGPDWVLEKAKEKGQPAEWAVIVRGEILRSKRR